MFTQAVFQGQFWRFLLICACSLIIWHLNYAYIESRALDTQDELLQTQFGELDRQLDQYSFIPKLLSGDALIIDALLAASRSAVDSANKRLFDTQQDGGLEFAFVLDTEGLTIASSNYSQDVSFVGVSYSFRPYFKQAITGQSATFFAVGATTGIPGYFMAEPVKVAQQVVGVVVAKVDLDVLVESWQSQPHDSMVTDEFGVIILSTRGEYLYTPTLALSTLDKDQLQLERRYQLRAPVLELLHAENEEGTNNKSVVEDARSSQYVMSSQSLLVEPWSLSSLVPISSLNRQAIFISLASYAALLIAFLLLRLYRQQQRLVHVQRINSLELEAQVKQRTLELASAQKRVVSESNFAMLGRMSAAINHEINQPLASLRLNLASLRQLIQQPDADNKEIEQIVVDSDRTTKRIGRVISSLRSVAKKNKAGFESISVDRLIDEVLQTITRERPVMSKAIVVKPTTPSCTVQGNEVLIQQALLNLLYNAFDAVLNVAEPDVVIAASIQQADGKDAADYCCISIVDNGVGVEASLVETLFEPFSTNSSSNDGLGLGLTIARQIAIDHGGQLLFRHASESLHGTSDQGSCFMLFLPLIDNRDGCDE